VEEGDHVEDTNHFVEKLNADKEKAERNKKSQGHGNPGAKLPNKKHSTNK
jgi:hypothetical protein